MNKPLTAGPQASIDVRCSGCRRLLFKMEDQPLLGAIHAKCPRCGAFNHLRPSLSPHPERQDREGKDASCGSSSPPKT